MIIVPTEKRLDWRRAPVMLFALVAINLLVFFFYQSGDEDKLNQSIGRYLESGFLDTEWPEFERHLDRADRQLLLAECRQLYREQNFSQLSFYLLADREFYQQLQARVYELFGYRDANRWSSVRGKVQSQFNSVSSIASGLIPNDWDWFALFSHQFLHGDTNHLLSNMLFLVLCGFAVEAAIGHWRLLAFYLLSGAAGGALFVYTETNSSMPLVGASGSISGVMAMYLAIFRFKRIEFFYWLVVLVGYIRLPALLVLPIYIGKELYSFYTDVDSNVAFMAHTGGFVAGGVLIGLSMLIKPGMLDREYVEEDQSVDPSQQQLAQVYAHIDRYRFELAEQALAKYVEQYGSTFELEALRCTLLKIRGGDDYQQALLALFKRRRLTAYQARQLADLWRHNPELQPRLDDNETVNFAIELSGYPELPVAEPLFRKLLGKRQQSQALTQSLGVLARRLSLAFAAAGQRDRQQKYQQLADALLKETGV